MTLKSKEILIVIPARHNSKRLPGKPLIPILGIPLLERVWSIAEKVKQSFPQVRCVVGTDDRRIENFCISKGISYVMTSNACESGTDRVAEVVSKIATNAEYIINLQGDNALCPPWFLTEMIKQMLATGSNAIFTPFVPLSWEALDQFRLHKKETPFSGTSVVYNDQCEAIWFSKNIIPQIRDEAKLRKNTFNSPVSRHIGVYGYHKTILENLHKLPISAYETYEGLEQLRWIMNGIPINMVPVSYNGYQGLSGIDSPEDVIRAEKIIWYNEQLSA